jgi:hypothetical protein
MGNIQATPVEDAALKEIVGLEFARAATASGGVASQVTTGAGVVHSLEGSGRFVKSFRVPHHEGGHIPLVVKAVQLKIVDNNDVNDPDHHNNNSNNGQHRPSRTGDWCKEQVAELQRIKAAVAASDNLRDCTAPFTYFWIAATTNPPLVGLAVREHVYTTLADRLSCRPWWTIVEKLLATVQLLQAVTALHQYQIYWHGGLSVYNVGLTSLHTVKLLDIGLNRPTGPLSGGMFHAWYKQHRCTVPPERFAASVTASASSASLSTSSGSNNNNNNNASINNHPATAGTSGSNNSHNKNNQYAAEDCFSVACIITELFTGSSWDLGEILARELPINNIELPAVRACCKHMLGPNRLDDMAAYLDRLVTTTGTITLNPVLALTRQMEEQVCPDARLALLVQDPYFTNHKDNDDKAKQQGIGRRDQQGEDDELEDLSKSVEAALKDLEQPHKPTTTTAVATTSDDITNATSSSPSVGSQYNNPHILYLHLVLATVRHAQRPSSKVRGLKLLRLPHIINATDDETRLQRIVPVAVQLLQDADAAVRATALTTLTDVVAQCTTFPPSDAQLFPQVRSKRDVVFCIVLLLSCCCVAAHEREKT